MPNTVYYVHVSFQRPGPANTEDAIENMLGFIGPQYNHNFSGATVSTSLDYIQDIDNYDKVVAALISTIKKSESYADPDKYEIQPHGLHSNNPRYDKVQLAWAFK